MLCCGVGIVQRRINLLYYVIWWLHLYEAPRSYCQKLSALHFSGSEQWPFFHFLFLEHTLGIATFHTIKWHGTYPLIMVLLQIHDDSFRVQRKSVLQFAIQASCSYHVLAQKSFQLAPTKLLTCRIGLIAVHFPQNFTCPPGKLSTECTSTIEKSTSPGLSNTTFFACWPFVLTLPCPKRYSATL